MNKKTRTKTVHPLVAITLCVLTGVSSSVNAQEVRSNTSPRRAAAAPATAAGAPQVSAQVSAPAPTATSESDVIGAWLEIHGQAFGLFKDEPETDSTSQTPNSGQPPRPVTMKVEPKRFTPPPKAIATSDAAAQIKAVMDDLKFEGACDKFADEKGFGPWGHAVIDSLKRGNGEALLSGTNDLRRACPNYDNLGVEERSYVWVNILATMAFKESSCDPTAEIPGIRKGRYARGILQLHKDSEHVYAEGCNRGDSRSPVKTLRCGISMLNDQIEKSGRLFFEKTYWGVLRPQGDLLKGKNGKKRRVVLTRLTIGALKELPLCQRGTAAATVAQK